MRPKISPVPWQTATTSIAKIQFEYAKFSVGQAYAYAPPPFAAYMYIYIGGCNSVSLYTRYGMCVYV